VPEPIPEPGPTWTWYVSPHGDDNNDGLSTNSPLLSVRAALQKAAEDKAADAGKWADPDAFAKIVILDDLKEDEAIVIDPDAQLPYPPITLGGTPQNPVTIKGTLTIKGSPDSPAITLAHVTLNGNGADVVVTVEGGNLVIENGAVITGSGKNNGNMVKVSGGNVVMEEGAIITGDNAAGVFMTGGTFTMKGGEIKENKWSSGVYLAGGTFTMESGEIKGNNGDGVYLPADLSGTFVMKGGEIKANHGAGLGWYGGTIGKTGGIIYGDIGLPNGNDNGWMNGYTETRGEDDKIDPPWMYSFDE
jgi:hypothetical protein